MPHSNAQRSVGPGDVYNAPVNRIVEFGQAVWASGDKELRDQFLEMCAPGQILHLLVGTGTYRSKRLLVPEDLLASMVDLLVLRAQDEGCTKDMINMALSAMGRNLEDGPAIELTLRLPGLAAAITPGTVPFETAPGRFIYQTLHDTKISMDMAFEMLYTQSDSSLAQVAETCRAFARGV